MAIIMHRENRLLLEVVRLVSTQPEKISNELLNAIISANHQVIWPSKNGHPEKSHIQDFLGPQDSWKHLKELQGWGGSVRQSSLQEEPLAGAGSSLQLGFNQAAKRSQPRTGQDGGS